MRGDTQLILPGVTTLRYDFDPRYKAESPSAADFLRHCLERFRVMKDSDMPQRRRSLEEVEFNSGKHWDSTLRKEREDKERVVMEVNRTPQYLNQVSNAQRMSRPTITIKPNGNGADEDGALVKQGIVKNIERCSDSESIRDDAFYSMLEKGWSFYRVDVEWEHEKSHRQVIRTKRIFDDFSVYCDPAAVEPDKSDAMDWFITQDIPVEQFIAENPDSELAGLNQFTTLGDLEREWISRDTIRVAEYWYKKREREKLYALADDMMGDGKWEDELAKTDDERLVGVAYVGDEPMYRWSYRTRVFWAKISAKDVLYGNADKTEGREWVKDAKFIPIVPVMGRRILIDGRYVWTGMIRDAMDPCLASDYWLSAITEMVALGPKAPWVVAYEAIAEYREMWDQSNIENYAALYYDKFDSEGNELPVPFRNFGEPPIQAMTFILNYAEEDLKRVMGIYNRNLGQNGPEHSGIAISRVQQQGEVANFNYSDNLKRSIAFEAKIYLDLNPKVMTEPQVLDIVRPEDNQTEKVWINKVYNRNGKEVNYDQTVGNYDVVVEIGPSMATRREAAAEGINAYLQVDPQAAPYVGDLLADNLDFPNKEELRKRLRRRAVAIGAAEPEKKDGGDNTDQIKQQYQAQAQQLEQVTQAFQQLTEQMKTEQMKFDHERELKGMELASRERIAALEAQKTLAVAEASAKSQASLTMLQATIDKMNGDIQSVRDDRTSWLDRIFDLMKSGGRGSGKDPNEQ